MNARTTLALVVTLASAPAARAEQSTWTFDNTADRFEAKSGAAALGYYDPFASGWGPADTAFGTASGFALPAAMGADFAVMSFPACAADQGYQITHGFAANGPFGETLGAVSNYTVVMDVLFPSGSADVWRGLVQTDTANASDAEFFVNPGNGIGINGNYRGAVRPDTWHRIVWAVRAADGEGQAHRYIDGRAVGALGTTGSGLGDRWALVSDLLLFTDENGETAPGYVASISVIDRKLSYDEAAALGGVNPAGADVPGPPPPAYTERMPRAVGTLGHRGASGCAPENTLPAIEQAFLDGAAGTEIDTRITADGVVVVFHDATVDRTTDGTGDIASMTLSEVKALDAGSWFSPAFAGTRVPTLAEALAAAKGKGILYLDIKTGGQAAGFADAVAASGFPVEDLWFWTPGNPTYAAEIRAAVPGAQIVWGGPDASWSTDPNYFTDLQALGVIGFSYGHGGADLSFSAAAKAAGMFVEVFTVLDPEAMIAAAEAGVDYIETDLPLVMEMLQPERAPAASGPSPTDGAIDLVGSPVLSWVLADAEVAAHRIHFGTANPPPFVVETGSDLFQTGTLEQGTTYYWQIDTVTAGGATVAGPVWEFTTAPPPQAGNIAEWHLDGTLDAVEGDAALAFGADSESLVAWETSDGAGVPHMADGPNSYLRVPAFADPAQGIDLSFSTTEANGGGEYINQFTFVFDVLVPGPLDWTPFFNTAPGNTNDSDFFVRADGGLGIGALGYAPAATIAPDTWHRVIFTADLGAGAANYYVDGAPVLRRTGASLLDGRFSLFDALDAAPHVKLFNDENGETHEMLVGAVAFVDAMIGDATAAGLGGASRDGIFFKAREPAITGIVADRAAGTVTVTWSAAPGATFGIEASPDLAEGGWEELDDSIVATGASASYTETGVDFSTTPQRAYRVFQLE